MGSEKLRIFQDISLCFIFFENPSTTDVHAGMFFIPPKLVGHSSQEIIPLEMKVPQGPKEN